ncbi:MAG: 50S ribosomal protein L10 [Chloroflexota bacterium]|uniref:Large ribosomal subunit protein uL10 n=1 Tax=Bellilinea caldifistulae TaxID=360411 RepID=A0A7C4L0Z5_9CHLR|nr:50S ribosomal protein L10 [Bellilinea sp.]
MAFTKQHKNKMVAQYVEWLRQSQGVFVLNYSKMTMKEIDTLRAKAREAGAELHVVKNTLMKLALDEVGIQDKAVFDGASLVGFAFSDAPALAKVLSDATAKSEIFAIKGGYLGNQPLSPAQVKALADLPPLPVMRAMLLGTISAPATKLVRTIAEPARGLAAVIKAYSEKGAAPAAA